MPSRIMVGFDEDHQVFLGLLLEEEDLNKCPKIGNITQEWYFCILFLHFFVDQTTQNTIWPESAITVVVKRRVAKEISPIYR